MLVFVVGAPLIQVGSRSLQPEDSDSDASDRRLRKGSIDIRAQIGRQKSRTRRLLETRPQMSGCHVGVTTRRVLDFRPLLERSASFSEEQNDSARVATTGSGPKFYSVSPIYFYTTGIAAKSLTSSRRDVWRAATDSPNLQGATQRKSPCRQRPRIPVST